ncbi:MAG: cobalamin-binding protein [Chitinophagaceae bacterium]|nr:MAG: cobalamin-binding protein [Chitinophagaceae bacterium]
MPVYTNPLLIPLAARPRVISLVPSLTELLYELRPEAQVVGLTRFCVHPSEWYHSLPRVGGTKDVKTGLVQELAPDLVIASREENVQEQVELIATFTNVWLTDIGTLDDTILVIREAGLLLDCRFRAENIAAEIETGFDFPATGTPVPAAYLIWRNPYMTVGSDTFIHDLMTRAGFRNVFGSQLRYPVVDIDLLREAAPEVLLLSSEPYPFSEKHVTEIRVLLPGVKVLLVDGELFSWYGSRLLHSAPYLRSLRERMNDPS